MTDPRETLARIRKQADAATEGPWEVNGPDRPWATISHGSDSILHAYEQHHPYCEGCECGDPRSEVALSDEDAEFIAAARTDVPRLVDALEKVLELHVRAECPTCGSRDGEGNEFHKCDDDAYCEECDLEGYPCPTVTAITTALGGEHHA